MSIFIILLFFLHQNLNICIISLVPLSHDHEKHSYNEEDMNAVHNTINHYKHHNWSN